MNIFIICLGLELKLSYGYTNQSPYHHRIIMDDFLIARLLWICSIVV